MFTSKSPSGVELMVLRIGVNLCDVCIHTCSQQCGGEENQG